MSSRADIATSRLQQRIFVQGRCGCLIHISVIDIGEKPFGKHMFRSGARPGPQQAEGPEFLDRINRIDRISAQRNRVNR